MDALSSCGEGCGWSAAVVAMLSFGSFGVPIKSKTCQRLAIDPLVFQSYKTIVCFLTSFLLLTALGHPLQFTPWGIVSAIFWVPGGVGTVASVQLAGLAVAVAVGNSCVALVSFSWGIYFFQEHIHSKEMACLAVMMMVCGFSGMSYFSTRDNNDIGKKEALKRKTSHSSSGKDWTPSTKMGRLKSHELVLDQQKLSEAISASPSSATETIELVEEAKRQHLLIEDIHDFEYKTSENKLAKQLQTHSEINSQSEDMISNNVHYDNRSSEADEKDCNNDTDSTNLGAGIRHRHHQSHTLGHHSNEMVGTAHDFSSPGRQQPYANMALDPFSSSYTTKSLIPTTIQESQNAKAPPSMFYFVPQQQSSHNTVTPNPNDTYLILAGRHTFSRRQVGIALAVLNGCWGGSIMVPMKFCPDKQITNGIDYVWSFSIGAMLVTTQIWVFRYLWLLIKTVRDMDNKQTICTAITSCGSRSSGNTNEDGDDKTIPEASSIHSHHLYQAYRALPSLHLKEMWRPGGLAGLLWSIGNLFSILSVDYLGEGVGYCVCQSSMLVSGLWGILYFKEVAGTVTITKWFLSALFTVAGILLLSYEHHIS